MDNVVGILIVAVSTALYFWVPSFVKTVKDIIKETRERDEREAFKSLAMPASEVKNV